MESIPQAIDNELTTSKKDGMEILSPSEVRDLREQAKQFATLAPKNSLSPNDSTTKYFDFKYQQMKSIINTLIHHGVYLSREQGKFVVKSDNVPEIHSKAVHDLLKQRHEQLVKENNVSPQTSIWEKHETYVKNIQAILDTMYGTGVLPDKANGTFKKPTNDVERKRNEDEIDKLLSKALIENIDTTKGSAELTHAITGLDLQYKQGQQHITKDNVLRVLGNSPTIDEHTKKILQPLLDSGLREYGKSDPLAEATNKLALALNEQLGLMSNVRNQSGQLQQDLETGASGHNVTLNPQDRDRSFQDDENNPTGSETENNMWNGVADWAETLPRKLSSPGALAAMAGSIIALWIFFPKKTPKLLLGAGGLMVFGELFSRLAWNKHITDATMGVLRGKAPWDEAVHYNSAEYLKQAKGLIGKERYDNLFRVLSNDKNADLDHIDNYTDELGLVADMHMSGMLNVLKAGPNNTVIIPEDEGSYADVITGKRRESLHSLWKTKEGEGDEDRRMAPLASALSSLLIAEGKRHGEFVKQLYPELANKPHTTQYLGYVYLKNLYGRDTTSVPKELDRVFKPETPLYLSILATLNPDIYNPGSIMDDAHKFIKEKGPVALPGETRSDLIELQRDLGVNANKLQGNPNARTTQATTTQPQPAPAPQSTEAPQPILSDIERPEDRVKLDRYLDLQKPYSKDEIEAYITPYLSALNKGDIRNFMRYGDLDQLASRMSAELAKGHGKTAHAMMEVFLGSEKVQQILFRSKNEQFEKPLTKERLESTVYQILLDQYQQKIPRLAEMISKTLG